MALGALIIQEKLGVSDRMMQNQHPSDCQTITIYKKKSRPDRKAYQVRRTS